MHNRVWTEHGVEKTRVFKQAEPLSHYFKFAIILKTTSIYTVEYFQLNRHGAQSFGLVESLSFFILSFLYGMQLWEDKRMSKYSEIKGGSLVLFINWQQHTVMLNFEMIINGTFGKNTMPPVLIGFALSRKNKSVM